MTDLTLALRFNPFDGDKGDVGSRKMRDTIVVARQGQSRCHVCGGLIEPGTTIRSLVMLWADDGPQRYRYCAACTVAMAQSWNDEGMALDARYALRFAAERT